MDGGLASGSLGKGMTSWFNEDKFICTSRVRLYDGYSTCDPVNEGRFIPVELEMYLV